MNEEKKTIYTLILGVCMITCLILIGKMMLYSPAPLHSPHVKLQEYTPEKKKGENVVLTGEQISEMITNQLPEGFPLEALNITIHDDSTIEAQGQLNKSELMKYLSDHGQELTAPLQSAMLLVPDKFTMDAVFNVGTDKESSLLLLTPIKVTAGGVELPDSLLIPTVFESLNKAINNALCESGIYFTKINLSNGKVELVP